MKSNNYVHLRGRIVHIFDTGKNCALVTLACSGGDNPKLVLYNEDAQKVLTEYSVGDYIAVDANIQSSLRKQQSIVSVMVDRILPIENEDWSKSDNYFYLNGIVSVIRHFRKCHCVCIKTMQNNHFSIVPVTFYGELPKNIQPGNEVKLHGTIQTCKLFRNGICEHHINYVSTYVEKN